MMMKALLVYSLVSLVGAPGVAPGAKELAGLWVAEVDFGPEVSGELEIRGSSGVLEARIQDHRAAVSEDGGHFSFELDGDLGRFRGSRSSDESQIRGHWIQPPSETLSYRHATPMILRRTADSEGTSSLGPIYVGTVEPLEDRLHFYLILHEQAAAEEKPGYLRAVLRNPERNVGKFMNLDEVVLEGTEVTIRDREGQTAVSGTWQNAGQTQERRTQESLLLDFPQLGRTIEFRRGENSSDFAGIHPTLASAPYTYRAPRSHSYERDWGDELDWPVASAAEVGLDPAKLEALVREIHRTGEPSVFSPYVHALLVARHGKLVLEEYFYTQRPDQTHDTRSAGKSVGSMMIGAAIDRSSERKDGFDLSTPFLDVFGKDSPEPTKARGDASPEQRQAWREQLTVGHLLSMSSGLDCDDDDWESPGNEGLMQDQSEQPDWTRWGLDLPMARPPGEKAIYCSNSINLAAAAMARTTERWLPEAFAEWIAEPLGIDRYHFNLSPVGDGYMGGGIRLTPRDLAKLGQVMLDSGRWKGKRVLSEKWVERSTTAVAGIHEPGDYAYAWWRIEYEVGDRTIPAFYASGNGGQLTIVVPEHDLVVQFSAGNYMNFGTWRRFRDDFVRDFVLPAVRD